jgi:hypothetical protein
MNILLDELKYEFESRLKDDENPSFEHVEILTRHNADAPPGTLLVCPLSQAIACGGGENRYFLCARDRIPDDFETEEAMRQISVVKRNMEFLELFNQEHRVFVKINGWVADMQLTVIHNEGIQKLLDLSETPIGNHISVMDSAFRLLAYTAGIPADDPVTSDLIKFGYHTEETVRRFQLARRIEQFEQANDVIVSDDYATSPYVVVKKIIKWNHTDFTYVVMNCNQRPFSAGLTDLFRLFLTYVEICVKNERLHGGASGPHDELMRGLLDGNLDRNECDKQAERVGIPPEGAFDLYVLKLRDTLNTPYVRVISELSAHLADFRFILYNRDIVGLNIYQGSGKADAAPAQQIRRIMEEQIVCCGISSPFYRLWDLRVAYDQACAAIVIGGRGQDPDGGEPDANPDEYRDYWFEDHYIAYMLSYCLAGAADIFTHSFAFEAVRKLREYEAQRGKPPLCRLLEAYLRNERNASKAGEELYMHRNTAIYHIEKIKKLLDVDLDDAELRYKLMLALRTR